ncbi:MAG: DegT/DnrJ/EryC1/StrS aminotransferase family protein [Verrucomicrobia bacterium]|nr:DegT/DnrJ/EryC1/StrS aminotransferase family protein [Verrucomicrobiota bacterium]
MSQNKITLAKDTIDNSDIDHLIEWLKTYPRLTKGEMTIRFEEEWSKWIGCKYSVFVNSGSSANLLMLYAAFELYQLRNKKVAVPALGWATDLSPIMQLGLEPILIDCNLENLAVDVKHLEEIFIQEKPSVLILVSVLGLSPHMKEIVDLCKLHNVILLEDNCESQGSKYNGVKLGNFGLMSSFSTYYGHTMSTIEGGMITTNDKAVYEILKQLRSHGWDRDLDQARQNELRSQWGIDDFSALYTFYVPGFNLRSTDLQAYLGLRQLQKVDSMIENRNKNFHLFKRYLSSLWFPEEVENSYTSSFCIPILAKNKSNKIKLAKRLFENQIECRPLICGSMGTQPFYIKKYGRKELPNAKIIDEQGLYIPNHHLLSGQEIEFMCSCISNEFSERIIA